MVEFLDPRWIKRIDSIGGWPTPILMNIMILWCILCARTGTLRCQYGWKNKGRGPIDNGAQAHLRKGDAALIAPAFRIKTTDGSHPYRWVS